MRAITILKKTMAGAWVAAFLAFPLTAQEPDAGPLAQQPAPDSAENLVLDLQGAIDYAIAYNKSLKNARMEVDRSAASVWESISQGLPQVEGTLDYMTYFNYEMEFSFSGGDEADISPEMIQDAFQRTQETFPFYTQNDLAVHFANTTFDTHLQSMMPPSTILLSDQSTAKLAVNQLIFSGQYIIGIQTAKLAKIISEQNYQFNELGIKELVINSYYMVLITEESLDILRDNVDNMQETLTQTESMVRAGMAEQTDADQLRITVNQLDNSLTALERNLELNYNLLRFQLGLPTDVEIQLTDGLEALFVSSNPEMALVTPFNMDENITYQLMKSQEEINGKLWSMEKWNYAPTLLGFYNYNAKILTSGFDMNPNHLAGLSLAVPIFSSGMRKARVDQAKIDYEMSVNNRIIMEDQLNLQERQFRYDLESALENFETQRENVEVAQRVYDSYRRKYEQGMATSLDLTQANGNYLDAESNFMQSIMQVLNAKLALDKLMNKL
jgi:outer membrane protein TolC